MAPKLQVRGRPAHRDPPAGLRGGVADRALCARAAVPDHSLQAVRLAGQCAAQGGQADAGRMGEGNTRAAPSPSSRRCATWSRPPGRSAALSISTGWMPNHDESTKPLAESYWVIPDRLLAGKYPGGKNLQETRAAARPAARRRLRRLHRSHRGRRAAALRAPIYPTRALRRASRSPITACRASRAHMARDPADARRGAGRRAGASTCIAAPGIGRTGTVVACHLIEHGLAPDAALHQLNELWQQSDRSGHLARSPGDRRHSATTSWASRREAADPDARARCHGCRAHACATASRVRCWAWPWATRWPRTPSSASPAAFAAVGDLLGGGPFDLPRGAWTDDTAMALLLAESLLEREGFDAHDQVQRYVALAARGLRQRHRAVRRASPPTWRARWRPRSTSASPSPGRTTPSSSTRSRCRAWRRWSCTSSRMPRRRSTRAAEAARITAQAPMVLDCVRLFAAMLRQALSGRDKAAVLRPPRDMWVSRRAPVRRCWRSTKGRTRGGRRRTSRAAGTSCRRWRPRSGPFNQARAFAKARLLAANLGRDSDVVTAVYGATRRRVPRRKRHSRNLA